ncbi:uncharacterized protein LOC135397401 isoform X2 [Ornithodoros turicata]|uniref:uncharacterized protein LOC135397401 isoform X2 n=1 Tax=Ornithodoros turicata TaxID=34597 RepID=UPI003139DAFE
MATTQKGQPRISRRYVACFVFALFQTIIGIGLLAIGAADIVVTLDHDCKDKTGASFLQGVICLVSGSFATCAYLPRKVDAEGRPNRVYVAIHVLLSFLVAVISFNVVHCLASYTGERHTVILTKVVLTYTCHVLGGICAGISVPDLCRDTTLPLSQERGLPKHAAPVKLPEARSHIQESPATGEKLTVVTLPEADVVYAVPEQSYVIRRVADGSYVAPPGNPRLTPFFPTYTKVPSE